MQDRKLQTATLDPHAVSSCSCADSTSTERWTAERRFFIHVDVLLDTWFQSSGVPAVWRTFQDQSNKQLRVTGPIICSSWERAAFVQVWWTCASHSLSSHTRVFRVEEPINKVSWCHHTWNTHTYWFLLKAQLDQCPLCCYVQAPSAVPPLSSPLTGSSCFIVTLHLFRNAALNVRPLMRGGKAGIRGSVSFCSLLRRLCGVRMQAVLPSASCFVTVWKERDAFFVLLKSSKLQSLCSYLRW